MIHNEIDFQIALLGLISYLKTKPKFNFKQLARFFLYHDLKLVFNEDYLLSTSNNSRTDFKEIYENLNDKLCDNLDFKSIDLSINTSKFTFSVKNIYKGYLISKKVDTKKFINKLIISAYCTYLLNSIDTIPDDEKIKTKSYCGFLPLFGIESIVAQVLKNKCKTNKVFMYQHAIFQDSSVLSELDKILFNKMNYKFIDKLLVWGDATYNEMKKILGCEHVIIAGSLKKVCKSDFFISNNIDETSPVLFMSTDRYSKANIKALELLLEKYTNKIYIKKHPSSNICLNKYSERIKILSNDKTVSSFLGDNRFGPFFVVNSTVYYDIYRLGMRAVIFEFPGMRKLELIDSSDSVSNRNDMQRVLSQKYYNHKAVNYFFNDSIDKYSEIIFLGRK